MPYVKSPLFVAGLLLVAAPLCSMNLATHIDIFSLPEYEFSVSMEVPTLSLQLLIAGVVALAMAVIGGRRSGQR